MEAVPSTLNVNVQPDQATGPTSQIDIVNTSTTQAITHISLSVQIFNDGRDVTIVDPCPTESGACIGQAFAIAPTLSRAVTVRCPALGTNDFSGRMFTATVTYADGMSEVASVNVNCASHEYVGGVYVSNIVFPSTAVGGTSNGTLRVAAGFAGLVPINVDTPSDPTTFSVTTCKDGQTPCAASEMAPGSVGVACHPTSPGPHEATLIVTASSKTSTAQLICNGGGTATDPGGADGVAGPDGGADGGGPGPGGTGNAATEPQSFYACTTGDLASVLPILIALVLVALRRR